MKFAKLFSPAIVSTMFAAAALVAVMPAHSAESVETAGNVSYVSGGVGADSIDRLNSLAKDFNLKLVFALRSGDYVSDVQVNIASASGKTLLDTASQGPWFLTRLPAGKYQIAATFAGKTEKRSIVVGKGLRTVDFRWGAE
ncbi:MAG: carboxypeptidase regulatory-like domain-containing protein [Burkholderiales bacterium]